MISDAELTVLYGNGLRPETAMRLIDDLRRERKATHEWEVTARSAIEKLLAIRGLLDYKNDRVTGEEIRAILDGTHRRLLAFWYELAVDARILLRGSKLP